MHIVECTKERQAGSKSGRVSSQYAEWCLSVCVCVCVKQGPSAGSISHGDVVTDIHNGVQESQQEQ